MPNNKGFTIIEMLVAALAFALVVGAASGLFVSGLKTQRKSIAYQQLLDQTSYMAEYMSRALRMARKDIMGNCLISVGAKYNYERNATQDRVRFINYQGKCQEFFWNSGTSRMEERKSTDDTAANFQPSLPLNSDDLQVLAFKVTLSGESQDDSIQPMVTIFLDVQGKEDSGIKIQTSVSQRNLDVRK